MYAGGPATYYGRPLGEIRSPGMVILLTIFTLGIYSIYWYYKNFEDLKQYSGQGIGGGMGLLLALVFAPVNWFLLPDEVAKLYQADGVAPPVTAVTGCWIFLPLIGGIIWVIKVQDAINAYWRVRGAPG